MVDETTPGAPGPAPGAASDAAPDATPGPVPGGPEPGVAGAPEGDGEPRSVIDASVDFVQTSVAYARQELGAAVRDKAIVPVRDTAIDVAVLLAMALTIFLGIAFIAVGLLMLLAHFIGWIAAMFVVGGVLLIVGIIVIFVIRGRMEARKQSL
jgi:hypothetical protein